MGFYEYNYENIGCYFFIIDGENNGVHIAVINTERQGSKLSQLRHAGCCETQK